ncbi:MAG: alanine--tRNA ligase [Candidatus Eisenbacteria bacterium]|uniref:Alanine--tRNA ligase n=1 Tax=Eiseniibacteriota bacterium TaxID=2212470 RepID=A0A849SQM3_UNCEI|nr:alanine--tRNA ligase [Candidatus Eisenbacteria bacterium]
MTGTSTSTRPRAAAELRKAFLDFFIARGHTAVPSSPLVPNDPTLLFTTAGMVQFKPYYTEAGEVPYTRATSIQKCLRLTDLENVGRTPRHATFFEMLGNFSFGPRERGAYFKEEAIAMAWEFVTRVLQMPVDRLYPSVFEGEGALPRDDEAIALWKKMGVPESRIVLLGRADNFWGPAGGQGACGPSSEIYFDLGEQRPEYLPEDAFWGERPGDPGDRFMEFWNLVFPQFDAQADGSLKPLPRPGIDTGMGLDRLALLMQDKRVIHETDLFAPLVEAVLAAPHDGARDARVARVNASILADHARALTFAIGEGAIPGNEGAGYVLRRLLRRAVVRARSTRGLKLAEPIMAKLAGLIVENYGDDYPELERSRAQIARALEQEEASFGETYEAGLTRLEAALAAGSKTLTGEEAFQLHDTYGFPIELTEEIAAERGVVVDHAGFERAMEGQRTRARAASKFEHAVEGPRAAWTAVTEGSHSEFVGYKQLQPDDLTIRRWREVGAHELELVLDRTPFYAESGGQVADHGRLETIGLAVELVHVYKEGDAIVHRVRFTNGTRDTLLSAGARGGLKARVEPGHRFPVMRHHTATHLLHAVLRDVLGAHVRQAGSLVAADRLRFDYTHFEAPSEAQLSLIEHRVAEWALRNTEVKWEEMPIDEAKKLGAMALFGEKYGAVVRMVTVAGIEQAQLPISRELCGGTHVRRTGDIGAFVIVADSAVASGVRRLEAHCGHAALEWLKSRGALLERAAAALQVKAELLPEQIEKLRAETDRLRRAQSEAQKGGLEAEMQRLVASATEAPGGRWLVAEITSEADANAVRDAADRLRGALKTGAAVLALQGGGKLTFLAAVTDDLVASKKLSASELVKKVAQVTGGSGGGKPHLALAGGKDVARLGDALAEAKRLLVEAFGA